MRLELDVNFTVQLDSEARQVDSYGYCITTLITSETLLEGIRAAIGKAITSLQEDEQRILSRLSQSCREVLDECPTIEESAEGT